MREYSASYLASLPPQDQATFLASLTSDDLAVIEHDWRFWARDDQLAPPGDWDTWLCLAGRGWGKTRTGAGWINEQAEAGFGPISLIGPTAADTRDVMVEGPAGIIASSRPDFRPLYEVSRRRVTWPNGVTATLFSAEEPERLRGPQFSRAWYDELCAWTYQQETFDLAEFGLRLERAGTEPRKIVTTTPKPTRTLKAIIASAGTHITRGSTMDNVQNLSPKWLEKLRARYEGTRLGRQELLGEVLDDVPGALWTRDTLEAGRATEAGDLSRVVVAIDPPVTSGEDADECGIVVAGRGHGERDQAHGYVIADYSQQGLTPEQWGRKAVEAYHAHEADAIVAEVNNGGEMIARMIKLADGNVPVREVRATRGKVTRAEPVAMLYEQGRVHHVGMFAALEDQMCEFTSDFDPKSSGYSPDRVDALVWALTDLMLTQPAAPRVRVL